MTGPLEMLLPYYPYLALVVRIWVGANMMIHGYPKLGKGRTMIIQGMKSMGVPTGATMTAAVLEFFGGIFLIIGLIVPIVAFFFAIEMIATTLLKKKKMKADYINPQKPATYELDITYLILFIVLIVLGAGAASLDSLIGL
jgi:putative oxidoreductase